MDTNTLLAERYGDVKKNTLRTSELYVRQNDNLIAICEAKLRFQT